MTLSKITMSDYKKILQYYNLNIPKSNIQLKQDAHAILSKKLCKCIKKIEPFQEARAIGICTKTIFTRKGYTRGKFKCKGKSSVEFRKKLKLNKTKKRQTKKQQQTKKK